MVGSGKGCAGRLRSDIGGPGIAEAYCVIRSDLNRQITKMQLFKIFAKIVFGRFSWFLGELGNLMGTGLCARKFPTNSTRNGHDTIDFDMSFGHFCVRIFPSDLSVW